MSVSAPVQTDVCPVSGGDSEAFEWSLPTSLRIAALECGAGFNPLRVWVRIFPLDFVVVSFRWNAPVSHPSSLLLSQAGML